MIIFLELTLEEAEALHNMISYCEEAEGLEPNEQSVLTKLEQARDLISSGADSAELSKPGTET